jgi:hypothetical protein
VEAKPTGLSACRVDTHVDTSSWGRRFRLPSSQPRRKEAVALPSFHFEGASAKARLVSHQECERITRAAALRYHEVQMMDTSMQLALSISVPTMAVLIGVLINNSRLSDLRVDINTRFDHVERRYDDMTEMWRSELHRVEEVLDARLKHLEER